MSIFQRIGTLIRSNINDLLDRAEDPEKMIKQVILDMEASVKDGKIALAAAITEEKKLKALYEDNLKKHEEWMAKASLAVEKGDDDLAREAIRRAKTHENNADQMKGQYEAQRAAVSQLRSDLDSLESKLTEAKAKKEVLIARHRGALAQKKIAEQTAGLSSKTSAFDTFSRMEEKVAHAEAQAQAAMELNTDSLEERFKALERDEGVEDILAALKAKKAEESK